MGNVRAFGKHIRWTDLEIAMVREHYATMPIRQLAALLKREPRVIQAKANALGLAKPGRTPRTVEQVREAKRVGMARLRAASPETARARQREWHQANRSKKNENLRAWHGRHFFRSRALRIKGVSGQDLARLWRKQRGRCALTGRKLDRTAEIDHIHARARGGIDALSNLRWLCREANRARRDLSDFEFSMLCEDVIRWIGARIGAAHAQRDELQQAAA